MLWWLERNTIKPDDVLGSNYGGDQVNNFYVFRQKKIEKENQQIWESSSRR
jgi:hypothetical protein